MLRRSQVQDKKRAKVVEFLDEWRGSKNRPVFYSELLQTTSAQPKKWEEDEIVDKEPTEEKHSFFVDIEPNSQSEEAQEVEGVRAPEDVRQSEIGNLQDENLTTSTEDTQEDEIVDKKSKNKPEQIKKREVVRHTEATKILSISNENRKFRNEGYYEYAPKGWMSVNIMAVEIGIDKRELEKTIQMLKEKNFDKVRMESKIYLSALGIKRIFYSPKVVDMIYAHLTKHTRGEKIKRGDIIEHEDLTVLEQASIDQEKEETTKHMEVDLDWHDYDLTPSFTLEGENLDDEEDGVNIYDTSELHAFGEPIVSGRFNDLVGYQYQVHGGKVFNSKIEPSTNKERKDFPIHKIDRYGLRPNEKLEQIMLNDFEDMSVEELAEREDLFAYVMNIIDEELTYKQQIILRDYFLNVENLTLQSIGQKHGVTPETIRQTIARSFKILRKKLKLKQSLQETKWRDVDEETSIFSEKKFTKDDEE